MSALLITNKDHRTTECSTSDGLGDVSWMQKATLQPYGRNVPTLLHIVQVRFARPSPTLVLQAKNAGMRRLEYEPTETDHVFLLVSKSKILRATAILSLRTLCSAQ